MSLIGNTLIARLIRWIKLRQLLRCPPEVCIETTSACNARCIMCPREDMDRPIRAMDFELFKKVVDDCVQMGVKCIKPHSYGEPFLTPSFDKYISYIRGKSGSIKILVVTNGALMSEKWIDVLIDQKVDQVNVSIDGVKKETYESIRKQCRYEDVVNNTMRLIERKKESESALPRVVVEIIRMPETEPEIPAFLDKWKPLADKVAVTGYTSRAGALERKDNTSGANRRPCFRLWKQLVVCSNGKAALCCADWNCKVCIGDLNSQSINEIWNGKVINGIRTAHLQRAQEKVPVCFMCNPDEWDSFPKWWFK